MTHKIKKLKGQPLLNPPTQDPDYWRRITAEDTEAMTALLETKRGEKWGEGIAQMHCWMRGAGIRQEVTEEDRKAMLAGIDDIREMNRKNEAGEIDAGTVNTLIILNTHFHMKELGLVEEATPEDIEMLEGHLESGRKFNIGDTIAEYLYMKKRFGLPYEVTEKDEKAMLDTLNQQRKQKYWSLAHTYYWMKEMGLEQEVTDEDKKFFREELEKARASNDGWHIARIISYMNQVMPPLPEQPAGERQKPPLKKYKK